MTVATMLMAVACGSDEPSRQEVARAELRYCESPHPLEWAPDAPTFHVMLRREYPTMSGEPRWEPIPGDVYADAARVAEPGVPAGYIVCQDDTSEILDQRDYFDQDGERRTFYRTRTNTHLRVFQARTARMVHEGRYSGGEPPEWQNEFVDHARYFGPGDLGSLRTAIRNALRE